MTIRPMHRPRPRWARFAVALGLACATAAAGAMALATPAHAQPPATIAVDVTPGNEAITTGDGGSSFTVTLTNNERREDAENVSASVSTPNLDQHVQVTLDSGECDSSDANSVSCGELEARGGSKQFSVHVDAPHGDLDEGQNVSGTLQIDLTPPNNGEGNTTATIDVTGGQQDASGVSGTVTDTDDEPVEDVEVTAVDSEDGEHGPTTTGSDGSFTIDGPLPTGRVELTFEKEGYESATDTVDAEIGESASVDMQLAAVDDEESDAPPPEGNTAGEEEDEETGLSSTMWLLIALGALLIVGGIVAIVMLLRKGKNDDDDFDGEDYPEAPPMHNPSATQTGQLGVYDAAPPRPGMNSETMIHNGPLYNDDELARYGSDASPTSGFGPAYDEPRGDARPTQMVDPGRDSRYPPEPDAQSTRMYPQDAQSTQRYSQEPPSDGHGYGRGDWGDPQRDYGREQPRDPGYGRDDSGYGRDDAGREPRRRRYRDDYDDRPRSW